MNKELHDLHLEVGRICGEDNTCRNNDKPKQNYGSEENARKIAIKMSAKFGRDLEEYPCAFCNGWHIGRRMSENELRCIIDSSKIVEHNIIELKHDVKPL